VPGAEPPFSFQELDMMRTFMLMPKLFSTPGALIEGVFSSLNGLVTNPTDMGFTLFAIRQVLYNLNQLEFQLAYLDHAPLMGTVKIEGKIVTDPVATAFMFRYVDGPALITQLASRLAFTPIGNYFAPSQVDTSGKALSYARPRMF
jgi:hypothetical protein